MDNVTADTIVRQLEAGSWTQDGINCCHCPTDQPVPLDGPIDVHGANCVYVAARRYVEANPA